MLDYKKLTEVSGFVDRIFFPKTPYQTNSNKFYYIFKFKLIESREDVMIKGDFTGINLYKGLQLKLKGKFEYNSKFKNYEFTTETYQEIAPGTKEELIAYLANYIPHLGRKTAEKLYKQFGDTLIDQITNQPHLLEDCLYLTEKQKESIVQQFTTNLKFRDTAIYLQKFQLSGSKIRKTFEILGEGTKRQLSINPYLLVEFGITTFDKCDRVALQEGFSPNAEERIRACILQVLKDKCFDGGHLYLTFKQLYLALDQAFKLNYTRKFFLNSTLLKEQLVLMHSDEKIQIQKTTEELLIYPSLSYEAEQKTAEKLAKILQHPPIYETTFLNEWIKDFQLIHQIKFTSQQIEALKTLTKSKVCVITGNPGTGKSFLVKAFCELFKKDNLSFSLLAPTGIAAKNLTNITAEPSGTIHRKLQWGGKRLDELEESTSFDTDSLWGFNESNPYPFDIVLVDELSMLDQHIFYRLISALKDNVLLILIGDADQLASVNPGNVLKDLINCSEITHIKLTEILRQNQNSDIISIANKINLGEITSRSKMTEANDVTFIDVDLDAEILEKVLELTKLYQGHPDFQIISPMYKTIIGVDNLNKQIREILNPLTATMDSASINANLNLRDYDKIIITKNNYKKVFFNGEAGLIARINNETEEIELQLGGVDTPFLLSFKEIEEHIRLAYCLTVHKVQGNEYETIILPISNSFGNMLQRNLLYTAITRAKRKVIIVGQYSAFCRAISNNETQLRNSKLNKRISVEYKKVKELQSGSETN